MCNGEQSRVDGSTVIMNYSFNFYNIFCKIFVGRNELLYFRKIIIYWTIKYRLKSVPLIEYHENIIFYFINDPRFVYLFWCNDRGIQRLKNIKKKNMLGKIDFLVPIFRISVFLFKSKKGNYISKGIYVSYEVSDSRWWSHWPVMRYQCGPRTSFSHCNKIIFIGMS